MVWSSKSSKLRSMITAEYEPPRKRYPIVEALCPHGEEPPLGEFHLEVWGTPPKMHGLGILSNLGFTTLYKGWCRVVGFKFDELGFCITIMLEDPGAPEPSFQLPDPQGTYTIPLLDKERTLDRIRTAAKHSTLRRRRWYYWRNLLVPVEYSIAFCAIVIVAACIYVFGLGVWW